MRYSMAATVEHGGGAGVASLRQQCRILQEIPAWGSYIIPDVSFAILQLLLAFMLIYSRQVVLKRTIIQPLSNDAIMWA
jgi:hypothetical protein